MADNEAGWAEQLIARIGTGVKKRRTELGLSAQAVADRTAEAGHPIGRGAIARMETGSRGTVDVAELIVLANVLEVSPAALIWHDAPDTPVELFPDVHESAGTAFRWTVGELPPNTEESARQYSRLQALRRLLDARYVLVKFSKQRHPRHGKNAVHPSPEDISAAYDAIYKAEAEAEAAGWTVARHG